jgi:hypothetical protein
MNIIRPVDGSENTAKIVGKTMNLYLVEAGATHRFAIGKDRAEAVYEAFTREKYNNVRVYYITTLTDCTHDFRN